MPLSARQLEAEAVRWLARHEEHGVVRDEKATGPCLRLVLAESEQSVLVVAGRAVGPRTPAAAEERSDDGPAPLAALRREDLALGDHPIARKGMQPTHHALEVFQHLVAIALGPEPGRIDRAPPVVGIEARLRLDRQMLDEVADASGGQRLVGHADAERQHGAERAAALHPVRGEPVHDVVVQRDVVVHGDLLPGHEERSYSGAGPRSAVRRWLCGAFGQPSLSLIPEWTTRPSTPSCSWKDRATLRLFRCSQRGWVTISMQEGCRSCRWAATGTSAPFSSATGPRGSASVSQAFTTPRKSATSARGLARAGIGENLTRAELEGLGFYACDANLEEELTRAMGPAAMEELVETRGELRAFRTYQKQPAHRDEAIETQLAGFLWNRKLEYGALIVGALDLDRIPRPLTQVLAHALPANAPTGPLQRGH